MRTKDSREGVLHRLIRHVAAMELELVVQVDLGSEGGARGECLCQAS